ncbi:hypothetical protein C8R43DRAFT_907455, partial [Mycena crocata]
RCTALAEYRPRECRETLNLGRYPGRNQFISRAIWQKTGQRRTARQVGSRLQQLRDSCSSDKCMWYMTYIGCHV